MFAIAFLMAFYSGLLLGMWLASSAAMRDRQDQAARKHLNRHRFPVKLPKNWGDG